MAHRQGKALVVVALGACFSLTCHEDWTDPAAPTYRTDVQTVLENRCVSCHGANDPKGGWRATSYLATISCVSAKPVTLPADDTAPILAALDTDTHRALNLPAGERDLLAGWVKAGTPAFPSNSVHPSGFPDPRSPDFHAKFLRDKKWAPIRDPNDTNVCGRCHEGAPVRPDTVTLGAPGATACTSCHTDPQGPLGCTTCHGDPNRGSGRASPPRDPCFFPPEPDKAGAHAAHLVGSVIRTAPLQCSTCHPVPAEGHVFEGSHANGTTDIVFDPSLTTGTYDNTTHTCTVGCHNRNGARPTPKWTDTGPLKCGDCHSAPPANHYPGKCSFCHHEANDDGTSRVPGPLHMNGTVDLGDGTATSSNGVITGKCGACHGQGDDPFPVTGAHQPHENPKITFPVTCTTCHNVTASPGPPLQIKTPNHMDGKVELTFTGRALDRNASPQWDGTSCTSVACHGANLPEPPIIAAPQWKDPSHIPGMCGACHKIPPTFLHTTSITCDSAPCHGPIVSLDKNNVPSITPFGKTLHINGVINRF